MTNTSYTNGQFEGIGSYTNGWFNGIIEKKQKNKSQINKKGAN
jgi:hypothetical protein